MSSDLKGTNDDHLHKEKLERERDSNIRGSLRLEAATSKPIISAGEEISIYVVIRNPFSIPVKIITTETHIPVDIKDQLAYKRHKKKRQKARESLLESIKQGELKENSKAFRILLTRFRFLLIDMFQSLLTIEIFQIFPLFGFLQLEPDERVAIAVSPDEEESSDSLRYLETPSVEINSATGNINAVLTNKIDLQVNAHTGTINIDTAEVGHENILQKDNLLSENLPKQRLEFTGKFSINLYPGDSLVKHFVLKTRRWLFFNPVSHTFQIQVRYRVDERDHVDTIPFSVDIRAPMRSSIVGAIIGSVLGLVVSEGRNSIDISTGDFWLTMSRTIIFALIIIVAFARKSNVQQVVSVEDFWGGLFTGFLVGYSGDSFIQSILGEGSSS